MARLAPGAVMWIFPQEGGRRELRTACVGGGSFPCSPAQLRVCSSQSGRGFSLGQGETSSEGTEFKGIRLAMAGLLILP